jgi:hypothetical protein
MPGSSSKWQVFFFSRSGVAAVSVLNPSKLLRAKSAITLAWVLSVAPKTVNQARLFLREAGTKLHKTLCS